MARKRKRPIKFRTLKSIKPDQYLIFRSVRSGKITKWRKDRSFIVEVRSKKTKKIQGYFNSFKGRGKKKKLVPRKFTKPQLALKSRREITTAKKYDESSFTVKFNQLLVDQFRKAGRKAFLKVIQEIEMNDLVVLGMDFYAKDTHVVIASEALGKDKADFNFLTQHHAILLINALRSNAIRTSPKKKSKSKKPNYFRQGKVTLRFESFE